MEYDYKKGTTTVGLICKDAVIFAADKRATMGYYIANKETDKILSVDDRIAITTAGSVGDAQTLVRLIRAEIALFKTRNEKSITIQGAGTLLSYILQGNKFYPYYVQLLLGGINPDKTPTLFNIDAIGGMTTERFTATGSGSPVAIGILEQGYKENLSHEDAARLAATAISTAIKRDAGTGEGVDVLQITHEGTKRYTKEEVKRLLA